MTPIFSSPVAGIPYSVRRQSKTIANQRLPTIPEEIPLIAEEKRENMHIEKAVELRFIVPQAEVREILDHNEAQRTGISNIYLSMSEGKKLWNLLYKDQESKGWNKFIACPDKTVIIFQNMQAQFIVPHIEEEIDLTCHETLRVREDTISLNISEMEKLWNLFSKDQTINFTLNNSVVIPDGTLIRIQNKQDNDFVPAIETLAHRIFNFFISCFPYRK